MRGECQTKKIVADLALEKEMLQDVIELKGRGLINNLVGENRVRNEVSIK